MFQRGRIKFPLLRLVIWPKTSVFAKISSKIEEIILGELVMRCGFFSIWQGIAIKIIAHHRSTLSQLITSSRFLFNSAKMSKCCRLELSRLKFRLNLKKSQSNFRVPSFPTPISPCSWATASCNFAMLQRNATMSDGAIACDSCVQFQHALDPNGAIFG